MEVKRDWQTMKPGAYSVYRTTKVLVMDDAGNDGYNIGVLDQTEQSGPNRE